MFNLDTPVSELLSFLGHINHDEKWLMKQKNTLDNFYESKNIFLKRLNFIIITKIDSKDRLENIKTSIEFLNFHFTNKILICEYDKNSNIDFNGNYSKVLIKPVSEGFWRNYAANKVYELLVTDIIFNLESDVLFDPTSIVESYNTILNDNNKLCMPFDGIPIWMNEKVTQTFKKTRKLPEMWKDFYGLKNFKQTDVYGNLQRIIIPHPGFCYMININRFKDIGMENQNFVKHGYDDVERLIRAHKKGLEIKYSEGVCYHLFHERNIKNNYYNKDFTNQKECLKVANMSQQELNIYIEQLKNSCK